MCMAKIVQKQLKLLEYILKIGRKEISWVRTYSNFMPVMIVFCQQAIYAGRKCYVSLDFQESIHLYTKLIIFRTVFF